MRFRNDDGSLTELGQKLSERVYADFDTGTLYLKHNDKPILPNYNNQGYKLYHLKYKDAGGRNVRYALKQHRIIWWLAHNEEPLIVDHINGFKNDNRLVNLRAATYEQNKANISPAKVNKTGYVGVTRIKGGRYEARLGRERLGSFDTAVDAALAYMCAHSSRHGEFSIWNRHHYCKEPSYTLAPEYSPVTL